MEIVTPLNVYMYPEIDHSIKSHHYHHRATDPPSVGYHMSGECVPQHSAHLAVHSRLLSVEQLPFKHLVTLTVRVVKEQDEV